MEEEFENEITRETVTYSREAIDEAFEKQDVKMDHIEAKMDHMEAKIDSKFEILMQKIAQIQPSTSSVPVVESPSARPKIFGGLSKSHTNTPSKFLVPNTA
jgi:hypothetical protein